MERDDGFQSGERSAEAVMRAVPEGQVSTGPSRDVEPVRIGAPARVAIRSTQTDQHLLTCWDGYAIKIDGFGRDTECGVRYCGAEAQQLFDRIRNQVLVASKHGRPQRVPACRR